MVNLPTFFTSAVASAANSPSTFAHSAFFRPLFDMDTAFAFITFMALTIAKGD